MWEYKFVLVPGKEMLGTKDKIKWLFRYIKSPKHAKYYNRELSLGVKNIFRKNSAKMIMFSCTCGLIIIFIIAYFYHNLGLFVISVEPELRQEGFVIDESRDFDNPRVKLFSDALEECNNISVNMIPNDVDGDYKGEHNGKNYVAYTFYLKNGGSKDIDYEYSLNIDNVTKNVDDAAWVMMFVNGELTLYAKEKKDGTPERIYNYSGYPILEQFGAANQVKKLSKDDMGMLTKEDLEEYRYLEGEGLYELVTVPFEGEKCITKNNREDLEPGGVDKFTVIIWLEGEDSECRDAIRDGTIGLGMKFTKIDDLETKD